MTSRTPSLPVRVTSRRSRASLDDVGPATTCDDLPSTCTVSKQLITSSYNRKNDTILHGVKCKVYITSCRFTSLEKLKSSLPSLWSKCNLIGNTSQSYRAPPAIRDHTNCDTTVTCHQTQFFHAPPYPQPDRPVLELPTPEGRKADVILSRLHPVMNWKRKWDKISHPVSRGT